MVWVFPTCAEDWRKSFLIENFNGIFIFSILHFMAIFYQLNDKNVLYIKIPGDLNQVTQFKYTSKNRNRSPLFNIFLTTY